MNFQTNFVIALCICSLAAAGAPNLNQPEAWERSYGVTAKDGTLSVPGTIKFTQKEFFDVDPTKSYTLTVSVRSGNGKSSVFMPTIEQYDAQGRQIYVAHTKVVPETFTTLSTSIKKGDTHMLVANGAGWKSDSLKVIAFQAKEDQSDLPNYRLLWNTVTGAAKEGDSWRITLAKPLLADYPAGTGVRLHENGGAMFPAGGCMTGNDWKTQRGTVQGQEKASFSNNRWAPGAVRAKLVFLVNQKNEEAITELNDISLEVK